HGSVPGTYGSTNITLNVVQSIVLPNGRSYQFTYNSNGYLSQVTFPSGAYIRYSYTAGVIGLNVASRVVSSDGTAASEKTTTYGYSYDGTIQQTTVTDAAGGITKHYFDGSGRENKTETRNSTGTVLKQVVRTFETGPYGDRQTYETTTQDNFVIATSMSYDNWNNLTERSESVPGTTLRTIQRTYATSSTYVN